MKNLKWFIVGIIASFIMVPRIYAAPVGSSNLDYSSCYAFADVFKTISTSEGSYYYKYCYRATCSNGVYNKANMVSTSAYRCQNGNGTPYTEMTSDGCSGYSGSCSVSRTYYCTRVLYVDCNRRSDGSSFNTTTTTRRTTTKRTTTKRTTKRTTTTRRTTTKKKTTTKRPITTNNNTTNSQNTTTTTTTALLLNNTNISSILINDTDINYSNSRDTYNIKLPYDVDSVEISVTLEDPAATYTVEGNTGMPNEDHQIIITVTAQDGSTRTITINVGRYSGESNDCTLANIFMEDYDLDFSRTVYEYNLSLPKSVRSLDLEIVPSDELHAQYEVHGNENLEHNSEVEILVLAEDGTECVYTITIKKSSDTWKYILLILILVGVLGVAVYFLFKYLRKSKGKYKYE